MVPQWQTPYLGARYLPKQLSNWEVDHFFTLTPDERDEICGRFSDLYRLAVALQLGFLRMTGGVLDGVRILPRNLLEHLGAQLAIDAPTLASVRALYRRSRTRYQHQQWAAEQLGFSTLAPGQRRVLVTRLRQQARSTGDVNALMDFARRWLYEHRILIPSQRTLREWSAGVLIKFQSLITDASDVGTDLFPARDLDGPGRHGPVSCRETRQRTLVGCQAGSRTTARRESPHCLDGTAVDT